MNPATPSPTPQDIVFSAAVRSIQARKGSREAYRRMEQTRGWRREIDADLEAFVASLTSVFLATASADGQPYIQHRGGPPGFLRVVDRHSLAFVDFAGNRQYISQGNLSENPKAHLFLIDYAQQRRVKVWGTARVVEHDDDLVARLMPIGYAARPEQVVVFDVAAWDENCSQHIALRLDAADVQAALDTRDARIRALEAELARARGAARG
jgi:predicted pyridoxine 5'-phosphate oxidase superfamily flavin-nucleotide-binding protein